MCLNKKLEKVVCKVNLVTNLCMFSDINKPLHVNGEMNYVWHTTIVKILVLSTQKNVYTLFKLKFDKM